MRTNEPIVVQGQVEGTSGSEEHFIPVFRFKGTSSWAAAAPKRTLDEATKSILFTDSIEAYYVRVLLPPMNFD